MLKKIIIGMIAGIISGLFSTGGGMILVPAFIYLLEIDQRKARATSIACVLPMVITTSILYFKNKYINFEIGFECVIGGIFGGFIGAKFLDKLPENVLRISFIVFILYIAFNFIKA